MKNWNKPLLIALAVVLCSFLCLSIGLAVGYREGKRVIVAPIQAKPVEIITTAQDIPAGTRITRQMLESLLVPASSVGQADFLDYSKVVGAYAKFYIPRGVVLIRTMVAFTP